MASGKNTEDMGGTFEALENLSRRNQRRIDPESVKPVSVTSLRDIQRVIAGFAPEKQKDGLPLTLNTTIRGEDEKGEKKLFAVSAVTRSKSPRTTLLEGFETIKNYMEVVETCRDRAMPVQINGVDMVPPELVVRDPVVFIDPLVKHWFGGTRRGLRICWELDDGYTYFYDIYTHKLTRSAREG